MLEKFRVNIGELSITGPFTIPSGIVTTAPSVIARLARDISSLGFLTTKTVSLHPREGYREPIIHEYHPGCFVNAVGLANPGAESFLQSMKPLKPLHKNKPLVVSIMGETPETFVECAKILDPIADAFELNLSCPHVKGAGQSVGSDPEMVKLIIRMLKDNTKKPLIPKLSPNISNFHTMVILCEKEGADALSLINTVGPGTAVDNDGVPILSNVNGGLSGSAIKPLGLKLVREAASLVKIPIVASGGISQPEDVRAYANAGASLYGVGSSLALVETKNLPAFFERLWSGLEKRSLKDHQLQPTLVQRRTDYRNATVTSNESLADKMFELRLDRVESCEPGQFFFIRIPGVGEKPFSPLSTDPLTFLIRAVGPFTKAIQKLERMEKVQMRGPYGKGFPSAVNDGPLVMVGGGTGAGPIIMASKIWAPSNPKVFLGFSSSVKIDTGGKTDISPMNIRITIDPPGNPGEVVRVISREVHQNMADFLNATVFLCGPKPMMESTTAIFREVTSLRNIYWAREDVMKCGIGVCGSCGTPSGLRSCVDGPVIPVDEDACT